MLGATLAAATGASSCAPRSGDAGTLRVAAAASLTEALPAALASWPLARSVECRFDASSRLARQIEAGAPVDVFVSADEPWMDELERRGLLLAGSRVALLGNALVVVVPASSALSIPSPADLASPAIARIALAGETVPAGRYADASLAWAGVAGALAPRVVRGDSVRTALAWVAGGDASAAVVYATDARVEPRVRVAYVFPASSHPAITYPAAVLHASRASDRARALIAHLRGPSARAAFERAGFTPLGAPP